MGGGLLGIRRAPWEENGDAAWKQLPLKAQQQGGESQGYELPSSTNTSSTTSTTTITNSQQQQRTMQEGEEEQEEQEEQEEGVHEDCSILEPNPGLSHLPDTPQPPPRVHAFPPPTSMHTRPARHTAQLHPHHPIHGAHSPASSTDTAHAQAHLTPPPGHTAGGQRREDRMHAGCVRVPEQQLLPSWRHALGGQRLAAAAVELAACCATLASAVNPSEASQQPGLAVIHTAAMLVSFTCALLLMVNGVLALAPGGCGWCVCGTQSGGGGRGGCGGGGSCLSRLIVHCLAAHGRG